MEEDSAAGHIPNPAWLRQQERYTALVAEVRDTLAGLSDRSVPTVERAQRAMVGDSLRAAEGLATVAAGPIPEGAKLSLPWNRLPVDRVNALIGFAGNGSPLKDLFDTFGRQTGDALIDTLAEGLAAGKGPREIARAFRAEAAIGKARAENIARTEALRASREAARLSFVENSSVTTGQYRRQAALDGRTCPACWALSGKLYPTSQPFPSHPSCRCVLIPVLKSWAEITGDPDIDDTRPTPPTGPEVFAGLSEAQKREILGDAGLSLLNSGEVSLQDFAQATHSAAWGPGVQAATIQQARANAAARPF